MAARFGIINGHIGGFDLGSIQAQFLLDSGTKMRELKDSEIRLNMPQVMEDATPDEAEKLGKFRGSLMAAQANFAAAYPSLNQFYEIGDGGTPSELR